MSVYIHVDGFQFVFAHRTGNSFTYFCTNRDSCQCNALVKKRFSEVRVFFDHSEMCTNRNVAVRIARGVGLEEIFVEGISQMESFSSGAHLYAPFILGKHVVVGIIERGTKELAEKNFNGYVLTTNQIAIFIFAFVNHYFFGPKVVPSYERIEEIVREARQNHIVRNASQNDTE